MDGKCADKEESWGVWEFKRYSQRWEVHLSALQERVQAFELPSCGTSRSQDLAGAVGRPPALGGPAGMGVHVRGGWSASDAPHSACGGCAGAPTVLWLAWSTANGLAADSVCLQSLSGLSASEKSTFALVNQVQPKGRLASHAQPGSWVT